MDRFTAKILDDAFSDLPDTPTHNDQWWMDRNLDQDTIIQYAIQKQDETKQLGLLFDVGAWMMLGMMVGFQMGVKSGDPSFDLAADLERKQ